MITINTYNALKILEKTSPVSPMAARQFAFLLWGDNEQYKYLFTSVSCGDNGAVSGKKAWLCAGSILGKLAKQGLVKWTPTREGHYRTGYFLTNLGRQELTQYESRTLAKPQSTKPNHL